MARAQNSQPSAGQPPVGQPPSAESRLDHSQIGPPHVEPSRTAQEDNRLPRHRLPVIAAPMAGGPSTPELVAAVIAAGGFGFLAGGYLDADALATTITRTEQLLAGPGATADHRGDLPAGFGVNLFVPEPANRIDLEAFIAGLRPDAEALGVDPGAVDWSDTDHFAAKVDLLCAHPVAVVSFTFGLPDPEVVQRLHEAGSAVVVTVTSLAEAEAAAALGADGLCVQGPGAGGHRGTHSMHDEPGTAALLPLVTAVCRAVSLPVTAAGGISTAEQVRELLAAGAYAVQVGTLLLRSTESGASPAHKKALTRNRETVVTRAFTGRPARTLRNRFVDEHDADSPAAYPQLHQLTGPLRRAATAAGDLDRVHLWAGTGYRRAVEAPAADIVRALAAEL